MRFANITLLMVLIVISLIGTASCAKNGQTFVSDVPAGTLDRSLFVGATSVEDAASRVESGEACVIISRDEHGSITRFNLYLPDPKLNIDVIKSASGQWKHAVSIYQAHANPVWESPTNTFFDTDADGTLDFVVDYDSSLSPVARPVARRRIAWTERPE